MKVSQVKNKDIKKLYAKLYEKGYAANTIHIAHAILTQMFNVAVDDDVLAKNPATRAFAGLDAGNKPHTSGLTIEEQKALLHTGIRVGELCALTWDDVDYEHQLLHIDKIIVPIRENGTTRYEIHPAKTLAGQRDIPMNQDAIDAFMQMELRGQNNAPQNREAFDGYENFVVVTEKGHIKDAQLLSGWIYELSQHCNRKLKEQFGENAFQIRPFRAHVLRHTFATKLCEANVGVKATQSLLGHANVTTTLDVYTAATDVLKTDAIDKPSTYIKSF